MRLVRIGLLAALALAVSGCGAAKPPGSVPAGAEFAPASSAVYFVVNTDTSSDQWRKADHLLSLFPGRAKLLASFTKDLKKDKLTWARDIKPALGDSVHVVWVDFKNGGDDVVGYAKPKDEAKFDKLLESGSDPTVHRKIAGWTVFADKQAIIGRFVTARASGSLSGEKRFRQAMEKLPKDAAVRGYLNGDAVQSALENAAGPAFDPQTFRQFTQAYGKLESASFSASAEDQGVKVDASYTASVKPKIGSFSASLDDSLPAGALFYISFGGLEDYLNNLLDTARKSNPQFKTQLDQFENGLGFSLKSDLFPLFSNEGAIAVYRGSPIPGIAFMLDVNGNGDKAENVMKRIGALAALSGGAQTRTFTVDGVEARELELQGFAIFSAVADGKLVVTSTEQLLRGALGKGNKLSDDSIYKEARDAAGAPDKSIGFIYVNLKDTLPWAFGLSEKSGETVPPDVKANTKPLRSVLLYLKRDGKRISLSGFLTIK